MNSTQLRALVIAHEADGPARLVEDRLVERGFSVETHLVTVDYDQPNVANPFPDVSLYDLIVPMGSVRSLTNKAEIDSWIYAELDLLRTAHNNDTPLLGVCFGGQLLAEALGGSVEVSPVTEIGWVELSDGPDGPNPVGPGPWKEWHHDRFTAPPEADVLAVNETSTQLFRLGRTVGTQFHPEVTVAHIESWLEAAGDEYLDEYGVSKAEVMAGMVKHDATNRVNARQLVDWFLDEVAFPELSATESGAVDGVAAAAS